jgi:hypothetical protein|nr:MAG TPA: hypothetical protein [Caudoviricetes sp.]
MTLGQKLSPILEEIQDTLLENYETKPEFTMEGFKASLYIFQSALVDKMYSLQVDEDIPSDIKVDMALKLGEELRALIKTYCNIDTHELYS